MADGIRIPLGNITLDRIRMEDREQDPRAQVVWGQMLILGTDFHVLAVRVHDVDGMQTAVCDPFDRLDDIYAMNEGGWLETVQIPTLEGEWVMVIFPHGRG